MMHHKDHPKRGTKQAVMPVSLAIGALKRHQLHTADALTLCRSQQFPTDHEQVRQSAGDEQSIGILIQSAIAHLGKAEEPFDHEEWMLHFGPHLRFGSIPALVFVAQGAASATLVIGKVSGLGRMLAHAPPKNEPRLRQLYWVTAASNKAGARSGS